MLERSSRGRKIASRLPSPRPKRSSMMRSLRLQPRRQPSLKRSQLASRRLASKKMKRRRPLLLTKRPKSSLTFLWTAMTSARSPCNCLRTHQRQAKTSGPSVLERKAWATKERIYTLRAVNSIASSLASWLKEVILLPATEPAVNPSTETSSKTRTSRISTRAAVFFPWQTLDRAPTALSSSCASRQPHISTASMSSLVKSYRVGMCSTSLRDNPLVLKIDLSSPSLSRTVVRSPKARTMPPSKWLKMMDVLKPHDLQPSTKKSSKIAMLLSKHSSTKRIKRRMLRLPRNPQLRPRSLLSRKFPAVITLTKPIGGRRKIPTTNNSIR